MNRYFLITLLFLFFAEISYSQSDSLQANQQNTNIKVKTDSMAKSPTGAVLRSLALPGWGQYYVESYWKAPIFLAGWGTLIFFIIDNNAKYESAKLEYANYTGTDPNEKNYLYRKREYFRDYRDLNMLYLAGVYIVSAVDAYVGANLFEFNVDDKLTLDSKLNRLGVPEIGVRINF